MCIYVFADAGDVVADGWFDCGNGESVPEMLLTMANGTVQTAPMKINIFMLEVARLGFEPRSAGPKPTMMDPYTIGL